MWLRRDGPGRSPIQRRVGAARRGPRDGGVQSFLPPLDFLSLGLLSELLPELLPELLSESGFFSGVELPEPPPWRRFDPGVDGRGSRARIRGCCG